MVREERTAWIRTMLRVMVTFPGADGGAALPPEVEGTGRASTPAARRDMDGGSGPLPPPARP
ncbi:hypothetical protein GCM10009592_00350 [Brachybacterium rhamnosum]